jgi:hypothetical protein
MLSRRACIARLWTFVGAAGVARVALTEEAPTKATQEAARYQDHPNNMQMCGMCKFYIPPGGQAGRGMMGGQMGPGMMGRHMGPGMMAAGTCEVVEGRISPMGWCVLYQPAPG